MERAATDIYTFENLRNRGFTYVDKTAILKELVDSSRGSQFFISRPRRFGKSLAVSTLKCLFEVKRDSTAICGARPLGELHFHRVFPSFLQLIFFQLYS